MFSPLFPPPPGYQPPQISVWFALASVVSFVVIVLLALCLAALQDDRQRKRTPRDAYRPPE